MLGIMSDEEKVKLSELLFDLNRQVKAKIIRLKKENPLVVDYLDLEAEKLEKQLRNMLSVSPITAEDEAMVFFNHNRVSKNLSEIEHGSFPYLWDEKLYKLMKKAMDSDLGITNHWVKVLLASNLLELSLNQALINKKPELFDKLRKEHANILRKTEEVNKILEGGKLKRSDIHFINSHRVDADHPVPEFINELDPEDVKELISKVDECITCLQPLLQSKENDEYNEEDYLKGKYKTGKASKKTRDLYFKIKSRILENFQDLEARQKKAYVGFYYKDSHTCVCTLDVAKSKIKLAYATTIAKKILSSSTFIRNVENIGIYGVGHYQSEIKNEADFEKALSYIKIVYDYKIEN